MPRKPNNSRQTRALMAKLLNQGRTWSHGYERLALAREQAQTEMPADLCDPAGFLA